MVSRPVARSEFDVAEIARGRVAGVYILSGERLLVDRIVHALRDLVPPAQRAFNYDVFDADRLDGGAVVQAARTMPMMGKRRVVVVRGAHGLAAGELEKMVAYVAAPAPETVLVLVGEKFDTRLKFFAQARKAGAVVEKLEAPYESRLPGWVEDEARRQGVKLGSGVSGRLAQVIGRDLGRLAAAVEQLSLYAGPGKAVAVDDVDDVIADSRERNVFELCDATYAGQRVRALVAARKMLAARESAIGMVAMLARHARQLARIKALGARPSEGDIASALGVSPFFARPLGEQARRYAEAGLGRVLGLLAQADRDLKGPVKAALGEDVVLERLLDRVVAAGTTERR